MDTMTSNNNPGFTFIPSLNSTAILKSINARTAIDLSHSEKVQEECKCLELSDDTLRKIMEKMENAFKAGLHPATAGTASVKMLPSFVRTIPNGTEQGDYLALDLGGTNFRVILVRLIGKESEMTSKIFRISDALMKGTGEMLFDHIAACLAKFMEEHNLTIRERLPLGFTFSFPCKQLGLAHATLVNWTKGFKATGVEGKDVVKLLRDACVRRSDIDVDVVAVLNDTTGTMMACAFQEPSCNIGVICGTGTNACYMERVSNILKLGAEATQLSATDDCGVPHEMCVNTEWGAFGDDGALDFIRTKYDRQLDEKTINPGLQTFEKMISGMYMGELVRIILENMACEGTLFNGHYQGIAAKNCFPTKFVSEIEGELQEDPDHQFLKTQQILEEIGIETVTPTDCANVAYVCSLVSTRAAYLCAVGIATLLKRIGKQFVTVGIDGSVYRFHPTFKELLDQKIDELLDDHFEYQVMLSEDGSGRGAALVAAAATRARVENMVPGARSTLLLTPANAAMLK